jgi:hypothetical protein
MLVAQLLKMFLAFYGTRNFAAVLKDPGDEEL